MAYCFLLYNPARIDDALQPPQHRAQVPCLTAVMTLVTQPIHERLCQSCNRLVYFCNTQIELDRRREAGDCVAFCDPNASGTWMCLPECPYNLAQGLLPNLRRLDVNVPDIPLDLSFVVDLHTLEYISIDVRRDHPGLGLCRQIVAGLLGWMRNM